MSLTHLVKGQSDWQTPVNEAFDQLDQLVGEGTIHRVDNPVTALNGATIGSSTIFWTQLKGYKAVWLVLGSVTCKAGGYLQLPDGFRPNYRLYFSANEKSIFGYTAEANKMYIFSTENGTLSSLFCNTSYLVEDN